MSRLCALVFILLCCAGCASDAQKSQWAEVMKDARGDNMQMRGFGK
jgi:hypothetical protein